MDGKYHGTIISRPGAMWGNIIEYRLGICANMGLELVEMG